MFDIYILSLQVLTIGTGLVCLRRGGPVLLWLVWIITVLACVNENILVPNAKAWWGISRNTFYNIYAVLDISIWSAMFLYVFREHRKVQKLVVLSWIGLLGFKFYEIYTNGHEVFAFFTIILFCAACMTAAVYYFSQVLRKDIHNIKEDPAFWICCASLCFHSVIMVNLITIPYAQYWEQDFSTRTFDMLQVLAVGCYNVFLWIAFIFSNSRFNQYYKPTLY